MKPAKILTIIASSLLVGILYILPPFLIKQQFEVTGQPFVLNYVIHRDELIYMNRAREVYDGHWPPVDLYFDDQGKTVLNALPSLIMATFLTIFDGNVVTSYLTAIFIFSIAIFLLFFLLGNILFNRHFTWSLLFAYIGILTPIALRILNFDGA
ncbi:MAG: hypothetical protein Q8Q90_02230 [bacterium]|nr:hypothetical protein [bacterium]